MTQNTSSLPHRITLSFANGPLANSIQDFQHAHISIGSASNNTIAIPDSSLQPQHAHIIQEQGTTYIQAHNSGCYLELNGKVIARANLEDGDRIVLGNSGITCYIQIASTLTDIPTPPRGYQPVSRSNIHSSQAQQSPFMGSPYTQQLPPQSGMLMPNSSQNQASGAVLNTNHSPDEVTRYLCAAVHTDEQLRKYVIKHVYDKTVKAPGEAYKVDIIPVVRWALAARQRTIIRDILLVFGAPALAFFFLISSIQLYSSPMPLFPFNYFSIGLLQVLSVIAYPLIILLIVVLATVKPFKPQQNSNWLIMAAISLFIVPFFITFPVVTIAWLIVIGERLLCYFGSAAQLLTRKTFRTDVGGIQLTADDERRLRDRFPQKDGNVVVYSGYSPFAGSGINIAAWSLAIDVSKGAVDPGKGKSSNGDPIRKKPQTFHVSDLYTVQATDIKDLRLTNLAIEDKLYVNGKELLHEQRYRQQILPNKYLPPKHTVDPTTVAYVKEYPTEDIRYYQCIKVTSWKNDLILSIFVRFYLSGRDLGAVNNGVKHQNQEAKSLFMEVNYQLLTPINEWYREIDELTTSLNIRRALRIVARTLVPETFGIIFGAPFRLFGLLLRSLFDNREQRERHEIDDNPAFDYGSTTSLREVASSQQYHRHFQKLDKEMYVKLIENQLFDTLLTFLDKHDIDTTDLRQRQEAIINNGLMVTGGNFNATAMAFGQSSTVNMDGKTSLDSTSKTTS